MRPREVVSFLLRLIQLSWPLCTIRIWHFASCPADLRRFSGHSGLGALVANIGSARRDARRNLLRPFEQQHTADSCAERTAAHQLACHIHTGQSSSSFYETGCSRCVNGYPEICSQLRSCLALPPSVSQAIDRDMGWLTSPLDLRRNTQFREP